MLYQEVAWLKSLPCLEIFAGLACLHPTMMCRLFKIIQLLGIAFFGLGSVLLAENWMWHGAFPWIYSHDQEEWIYWRPGMDGRFYQWSQSAGGWQIYNDGAAE